jgi:hypothetical protein
MRPKKVVTTLSLVLACAFVAKAGFAQTPATPTNVTAASGDQQQSAAAMAQAAANPFSSRWLMQMQQNNNWLDMPDGIENRVQSNVMFQPLLSVALSQKWGLYVRPVATIVNSVPLPSPNAGSERISGFGDTVVGVAAARPLLGGRLVVGAGPTFVFPTASEDALGRDNWQVGPDVGATLLGKNFIAYGFVQQWFKAGGDGGETSQMNGVFNFTYTLANGMTIGTQPSLSVDWKALDGERVAFSIGPQVGKLCRCGSTPTLFQVQFEYYPVRPDVVRPEVEYSAPGDANDSRDVQEGAVLIAADAAWDGDVGPSANREKSEVRREGRTSVRGTQFVEPFTIIVMLSLLVSAPSSATARKT